MTPLGTFLDGQAVTALRGLAFLSLSARGSIGTLAGTSNAGGGATSTWTYGTALPCRVDPLTQMEAMAGEETQDRSTHLITIPTGNSPSHTGRFAVGTEIFEITTVREQTREWVTYLEAVKLSNP